LRPTRDGANVEGAHIDRSCARLFRVYRNRVPNPKALELLLGEAGFSDVRVESVAMTLELASAAEYLQIFSDVAWKARVA